jgi:predicted deacylase
MPNPEGIGPVAQARNSNFVVDQQIIKPGESRVVNLPLPGLYTMQSSLNMAVHVLNGKYPGPRLFVCAAIHGNELNGVEIIRRLFKRKIIHQLKGTLIAIPIVNIFGVIQHSRYLPDGRDLNRSFPGTESGSLTSRLAKTFTEQIINQCSHGIDLHTAGGHRTNLPQIRADFNQPGTLEMAKAFGVPVIIDSPLREGSLRETAGSVGVPLLVYEAGEAMRFDPFSIKTGVNGVISVMRYLSMLPKLSNRSRHAEPYIAHSSSWVRAPISGILNTNKQLGDRVKEGELLGIVTDPSDLFSDPTVDFHSPFDGVVIGHSQVPLVNEGDAIYHIASFENAKQVAQELESFQDETMEN